MSRKNCEHCNPSNFPNPTQFKEQFKIGDIVSSWPTGKTVRITAIGKFRFLAVDTYDEVNGRESETVCTMKAKWRKVG